MGHSVKITTPIPSLEDVASGLGVTGVRLSDLLALVDRDASQGRNGFRPAQIHADKVRLKRTKPAASRRAKGKRVRTAR